MTLNLKSIRLDGTCHNKAITGKKRYLAYVSGDWYLGRFHKEWYGWNFDGWGGTGIQLDALDKVYEVGKMPK